jgi:hypothetical protein
MRSREEQRFDIENLTSINVWSEEQGRYVTVFFKTVGTDFSV